MAKRLPTKDQHKFNYKIFKDSVNFLVSNEFIKNDDKLPKIMLKSYVGIRHLDDDLFGSRVIDEEINEALYNIMYNVNMYIESPSEFKK